MDDVERPLTTGEGGPYGALAARPMPPGLAGIFMPSLTALLAEAERIKGSPLTEEQVVRIRRLLSAAGLGPVDRSDRV